MICIRPPSHGPPVTRRKRAGRTLGRERVDDMTLVTQFDAATAESIARAIEVLAGRRVAVLTGAGVSTDSGIPDYRGKGAPVRTPMTAQTFLASEQARRRYWVGSHLGWRAFAAADPNPGHRALARLEGSGIATGVITQNVDGLHVRAGSRRVVELHGTMRRVFCTHCGQVFDRRDLAARVQGSEALVIAGSSLVVNSGIRLLERARRRRLPVVIVNRGETRADSRATVKIDAGTSEVLRALAEALPPRL